MALCTTVRYKRSMAERTTMNVPLPGSPREWVDEQVEKGGYGSAGEYTRHSHDGP